MVETAQSKAAADQAALMLARRKADAAFGLQRALARRGARQAIMARLAAARAVLVRVTFPLGALGSAMPRQIADRAAGRRTRKSWTRRTIWEAPADPALPGRGFYALLDGSDLAQNEHVTADGAGRRSRSRRHGARRCAGHGESEAWVYVQTKPGTFLRTTIDTGKPHGRRLFRADGDGIQAGQEVVTGGAGLLLAREPIPAPTPGIEPCAGLSIFACAMPARSRP